MLTLEDPYRFEKSRTVGAYLLVPARDHTEYICIMVHYAKDDKA